MMKKLLGCFGVVLGILLVGGFLLYLLVLRPLIPKDPVLEYLPKYDAREFYTSGDFQDYTDYAKYTFGEKKLTLETHPNLRPVTQEDIEEIQTYLDNFVSWVDICQEFPKEAYDFDRNWLTEGDYFYLEHRYEEPEKKFGATTSIISDRKTRPFIIFTIISEAKSPYTGRPRFFRCIFFS